MLACKLVMNAGVIISTDSLVKQIQLSVRYLAIEILAIFVEVVSEIWFMILKISTLIRQLIIKVRLKLTIVKRNVEMTCLQ